MSGKLAITTTVNGEEHEVLVEPRLLLVNMIRESLHETGTHIGCDTSSCGACTVLLDGKSVKSCMVLAVQTNGREVTTVEGLETADGLHPVQKGFKEEHGVDLREADPDAVRALGFTEEFIRTWEFYLAFCEAGFRTRALGDLQMVISRAYNGALPRFPEERLSL